MADVQSAVEKVDQLIGELSAPGRMSLTEYAEFLDGIREVVSDRKAGASADDADDGGEG